MKRVGHGAGRGCSLCQKPLGELLELSLRDPDSKDSVHALAHFVEQWRLRREDSMAGEVSVEDPGGMTRRYRVRFAPSEPLDVPLSYFDDIRPAGDFQVKNMWQYGRAGYGAPLIALRENRGRESIERFYPPEGIARAMTAVIRPGKMRGGVREVEIGLVCPLRETGVVVNGQRKPLAASFSAHWGAFLARTGTLKGSRILEALRRKPKRTPQLYLMQQYDSEKEPLIMIHGILDTSIAWAKLSNKLWSDAEVRERYQIWHFLYNTSAPPLYSGRILQGQLRELRRMLDPRGRDPAMRSTTLISHSMGSIVSRRLITRPGNAFWKAAFTRPLEAMRLSEPDRVALKEAFFWEPESHVKRVIFIAAPHRGSRFTEKPLGHIGRLLVRPPNRFSDFYERVSDANPGAFTEAYAELGEGKLDSVHALSPRQPTIKILSSLPNSHPVKVHSIIGDRGRPGPLEKSSDGIVSYWSSHLPDADSEKVVHADHGLIDRPETVEEIKRILKLP